jgi:hypothetical protein
VETKILIGLSTSEMGRRADFYDWLNALELPVGTIRTAAHGQSPARARNIIIRQGLEHNASHIFFIDDDCMVPPNTLTKLLSHNVDIVSGLYLMRNYPHLPIMFDVAQKDGKCRYDFLRTGMRGLRQVVNTGLGCALIKTDVFRAMPDPWVTLGELEKDHWCDDISFFLRAQEAGFKVHVDLDCPVGHVVTGIMWPNRKADGTWESVFDTNGTERVGIPQFSPTEEQVEEMIRNSGLSKV